MVCWSLTSVITSFSSQIVHVLKAVAIVTSEHLNLSTNFAVNQLFGAD